MDIRSSTSEDRDWIVRLLVDRWGATVVVRRGRSHDASVLPAFVALDDGEPAGLLTYRISDAELEVVTLDALRPSAGVGTALLEAVRAEAEAAGCRRMWLITSNDNLAAMRFYQRRGFRLVAVHVGALDRAREFKPAIPEVGPDGIGVHDEVELAYALASTEPRGGGAYARPVAADYFDNSGRADVLSGGVRMIPVDTPIGQFKVWTKRTGNNPRCKLLLLHGGPGGTHEYFEAFDSFLPGAGVEYYYYDQLGSAYSDQPDDSALWEIDRFVDEVEQVRVALGLGPDNFFLLGHSWGGILAVEYALAHQDHLKGLVIANMMMSIPAYNRYAEEVLMPAMDQAVLAEIKQLEASGATEDQRYMELLVPHYYTEHILRIPEQDWPEPLSRMFAHLNPAVYTLMNGPSELGATGTLAGWDRTGDLHRITVPTLSVGATHDTMDPEHMRWIAETVTNGTFLWCQEGSHCAMYDDQHTFMQGLVSFLKAAS